MERKGEPKEFFTEEEQQTIAQAIAEAEKETSGEICVRIDQNCPSNPMKHAEELLHSLGHSSPDVCAAVLISICLEDRSVAIFGDQLIHAKIQHSGWQQICNQLVTHFRQGRHVDGLVHAISEVGSELKKHFPAGAENPNVYPDKPSFG